MDNILGIYNYLPHMEYDVVNLWFLTENEWKIQSYIFALDKHCYQWANNEQFKVSDNGVNRFERYSTFLFLAFITWILWLFMHNRYIQEKPIFLLYWPVPCNSRIAYPQVSLKESVLLLIDYAHGLSLPYPIHTVGVPNWTYCSS